jgi:cytochrome c-type biogenesis protein CcmE
MNRRFRVLAAVGMAVVLSTFLLYVGLAGGEVSEPVIQASEWTDRADEARSQQVQLDGVAAGPLEGTRGERFQFTIDGGGDNRIRVDYRGAVPETFRVGRNVIVAGRLVERDDGTEIFRAEPDTLVTKCPSKFESSGGEKASD